MKDAAKIPVTTHDSLDGRPDALASVEGRAGSVLCEGPGVWSHEFLFGAPVFSEEAIQ